jgi:hypothetical protein
VKAVSGEGRSGQSARRHSVDRGVRWGARRGEREREAFGIELTDDIGEHEGGAHGRGKPWHGQNSRAVRDGWKTAAQAATVVWTSAAWSKTDPRSVLWH